MQITKIMWPILDIYWTWLLDWFRLFQVSNSKIAYSMHVYLVSVVHLICYLEYSLLKMWTQTRSPSVRSDKIVSWVL